MRLIANRQLRGEYGLVSAGQEFDCREEIGAELLKTGTVRRPDLPKVLYETKVIVPEAPQVSPRPSFRDVHVPDPQPEEVASPGDPVLSEAEAPAPGATDRRGRRGRKGSGPGE